MPAVLFVVAMYAVFPHITEAQTVDGLRITPGARIRVMSTIDADRLEKSLGHRRVRGTIVGAALGTIVGIAVGFTIGAHEDEVRDAAYRSDPVAYGRGEGDLSNAPFGALAGAMVGFVGGAVIGALTDRERWETVLVGRLGGQSGR